MVLHKQKIEKSCASKYEHDMLSNSTLKEPSVVRFYKMVSGNVV